MKMVFELVWKKIGKIPTKEDGKVRSFYCKDVEDWKHTTCFENDKNII